MNQKKQDEPTQKETVYTCECLCFQPRKYIITSGFNLGHISPPLHTGAWNGGPMCFHLIVYIPFRRLSPYGICIVARGFCANNRVSAYAWPVFTEPNGPIRHRQRKRNTENDALLSQYRPFSLCLFAASVLSAGHSPASFRIACSYWIVLAVAGLALIISPRGGESRKLERVLSTSMPHATFLLLILRYDR
jgi:hypothetical protein